jgi:hypothetical protein
LEYSKATSEGKLVTHLTGMLEQYGGILKTDITPEFLDLLFPTCCGANGEEARQVALKILDRVVTHVEATESVISKYIWYNPQQYSAKELRQYYEIARDTCDGGNTKLQAMDLGFIQNDHKSHQKSKILCNNMTMFICGELLCLGVVLAVKFKVF